MESSIKKPNIMCIIGTRPEALKMCPIVKRLSASNKFTTTTIISGQHKNILDQTLSLFNIDIAENFQIMTDNQQLPELTSRLLLKLNDCINKHQPDMIIAQGDTTTTMTSALMAFYKKIPFAHIEAGLRSYNKYSPFPEEVNRLISANVAFLHFAPTRNAKENLQKEGITKNVLVVGNTVIDTLLKFSSTDKSEINKNNKVKNILVTCHRRENFGAKLNNICNAILEIVDKYKEIEITYPVHPNPNVRETVYKLLSNHPRIHLLEPVDYNRLITMIKESYLVITDSGGIQEEAPALNKPVLVIRDTTERPEGIDAGVAKLIGTEQQTIIDSVSELIENDSAYSLMQKNGSPYGDGKSSERIYEVLENYFYKNEVILSNEFEFHSE